MHNKSSIDSIQIPKITEKSAIVAQYPKNTIYFYQYGYLEVVWDVVRLRYRYWSSNISKGF
jgi:hypothetical protein